MEIDPSTLSAEAAYKLLIGCVVPRPIAWVSTLDAEGVRNLAPFSFFMAAAGDPPTLVLSCGQRSVANADGVVRRPKDTLANVLARGAFVVNLVDEAVAEAMNRSSAEVGPEVDEFTLAGVTARPSRRVDPPGVAQSPVSMEARLVQTVPVGRDGYTLVIGEVVYLHIRDDLYDPATGRIDAARLQAIGRMAGQGYTRTRDLFELRRPDATYRG